MSDLVSKSFRLPPATAKFILDESARVNSSQTEVITRALTKLQNEGMSEFNFNERFEVGGVTESITEKIPDEFVSDLITTGLIGGGAYAGDRISVWLLYQIDKNPDYWLEFLVRALGIGVGAFGGFKASKALRK